MARSGTMSEAAYRLLIIDDDVDLARMLSEYLAPESIELTSASNGGQGLALARSQEFDLGEAIAFLCPPP